MDSTADISLLRGCNYGITVRRAGSEVIDMADMLAGELDNFGMYNAFLELGLI